MYKVYNIAEDTFTSVDADDEGLKKGPELKIGAAENIPEKLKKGYVSSGTFLESSTICDDIGKIYFEKKTGTYGSFTYVPHILLDGVLHSISILVPNVELYATSTQYSSVMFAKRKSDEGTGMKKFLAILTKAMKNLIQDKGDLSNTFNDNHIVMANAFKEVNMIFPKSLMMKSKDDVDKKMLTCKVAHITVRGLVITKQQKQESHFVFRTYLRAFLCTKVEEVKNEFTLAFENLEGEDDEFDIFIAEKVQKEEEVEKKKRKKAGKQRDGQSSLI